MIEIWGKLNCSICIEAKLFCDTRKLKYVYKQLDVDFTREDILKEFPDARTFPQIKINNEKVGGFDDFTSYIENTNYNGTGYTL